jgi:hypothetical protein
MSPQASKSNESVHAHAGSQAGGVRTSKKRPTGIAAEKAEEGWQESYNELRRLDEKMVQEYREEIDTLLVFVSVSAIDHNTI